MTSDGALGCHPGEHLSLLIVSKESCFLRQMQFLFCCQKLKDHLPVVSRETVCLEALLPGATAEGPSGGFPWLWAARASLPLAACHLLGITMPFVLILVGVSFHRLLNEPLQKGWRESLL